jgi:iron(II)-dependent oxidoreductase
MKTTWEQKLERLFGLAMVVMFIWGVSIGSVMVWGTAAATLVLMLSRLLVGFVPTKQTENLVTPPRPETRKIQVGRTRVVVPKSDSGDDASAKLIEQLIEAGRTALLCRPELAERLSPEQQQYIREILNEDMARVSGGRVRLDPPPTFGPFELDDCQWVEAESAYLDRFPVTNLQFKRFVDDGGYKDQSVWDADVFSATRTFVDQTGKPGPRFWKNSTYNQGGDDHPVVGVNWYEAQAYARWVGKRLPEDAEWVLAAGGSLGPAESISGQPKYPWGNVFDEDHANLWATDRSKTVPVTDHPDGCGSEEIYQLIGNVWEWMVDDYAGHDDLEQNFDFSRTLKSIRGGAFDTYFENHATCQFQSGENPFSRKHNIGIRCILSIDDIAPELALPIETEASEMAVCAV